MWSLYKNLFLEAMRINIVFCLCESLIKRIVLPITATCLDSDQPSKFLSMISVLLLLRAYETSTVHLSDGEQCRFGSGYWYIPADLGIQWSEMFGGLFSYVEAYIPSVRSFI